MEKGTFNRKLLDNVYTMVSSMIILGINGKIPELAFVLDNVGISEPEMDEVTAFVNKMWSPEDLDILTVQQAKLNYLDAFREVVKLKQIADGYAEMGAINLQIAEESKHLEDEGEKVINEEMDSTKAEGSTKKD